jgi:hypothetical protein
MAGEEPEIGLDVEFGDDLAQPRRAAILADPGDAVEHQHGRCRNFALPGPKKSPRAHDNNCSRERRRKLHRKTCDQKKDDSDR